MSYNVLIIATLTATRGQMFTREYSVLYEPRKDLYRFTTNKSVVRHLSYGYKLACL